MPVVSHLNHLENKIILKNSKFKISWTLKVANFTKMDFKAFLIFTIYGIFQVSSNSYSSNSSSSYSDSSNY